MEFEPAPDAARNKELVFCASVAMFVVLVTAFGWTVNALLPVAPSKLKPDSPDMSNFVPFVPLKEKAAAEKAAAKKLAAEKKTAAEQAATSK